MAELTHWSVTVRANGEEVVTIESNCLSGRDIGPLEEEAIRTSAAHLLSFVGYPHTPEAGAHGGGFDPYNP